MKTNTNEQYFVPNNNNNDSMDASSQLSRKKWLKKEDIQLTQYLKIHGPKWLVIAELMGSRNASQCSQRWKRIRKGSDININISKQRWTEVEDKILTEMYERFGPKWKQIAQAIPNKNGRQVRSRFVNVLNPNLQHSPITVEEDLQIWDLYLKLGASWSTIASHLPGRSENCIKNRFYSHIKVKYLNQPNLYYEYNPCQKEQEMIMKKNTEKSQVKQLSHGMEQEEIFLYSNDSMDLDSLNQDDSCCFLDVQSNQCFPQRFK